MHCSVSSRGFTTGSSRYIIVCFHMTELSKLNTGSVDKQWATVDQQQCVYPDCGKVLEKSPQKRFSCCSAGVYCSRSCRQADWSRHKTSCQHSSTEQKLERPKPTVATRRTCASCGKKSDALKHCARCMSISYCSKSCQQADWPQHKTVCRSQMPQNQLEASAAVAETRDQDVIKRECNSCGKASDRLKHCSRCRKVYYCDRNCQQADWPRHKSTCAADSEDNLESLKPVIDIRDACASCGKTSDTLKKCTGCRKVSYCDRHCQQADWARHKSTCQDNEDKFEGFIPSVDNIRDVCASCGKTSDTLKKCTGCRKVSYCDRNCQQAHRAAHVAVCGMIQ